MSDAEPSLEAQTVESQYQSLSKVVNKLCAELQLQLRSLLQHAGLASEAIIQGRVKSLESVKRKVRELPRLASVEEIYDIVGIRIILPFRRDLPVFCAQIEAHFPEHRRDDILNCLGGNFFGYLAIHYVVTFPKQCLATPDASRFSR